MRLEKGSYVSVALGGGGAKGFVHLGVLQALTERGILIETIVGTSIGAIVGAFFAYQRAALVDESAERAQGRAVERTKDLMLDVDLLSLVGFNRRNPLSGLIDTRRLDEWLSIQLRNLGLEDNDGIRFDQLNFDFVVTATDANTGESLVLSRRNAGPEQVCHAVRASMSIQGVFPPSKVFLDQKQRTCWDGGTTGNCRFDVAHRLNPGRPTIASSLTYRQEPVSVDRIWGAPMHSIDVLMASIERVIWENLAEETRSKIRVVRPDFLDVTTLDFDATNAKKIQLINNGRHSTHEALDSWSS